MATTEGHSFKDFFPPGVATVDGVVGSSAVSRVASAREAVKSERRRSTVWKRPINDWS